MPPGSWPEDWPTDEELHPVARLAAADADLMQRVRTAVSNHDALTLEAIAEEVAELAKTVAPTFGLPEAARIVDMLCVMLRRQGESKLN